MKKSDQNELDDDEEIVGQPEVEDERDFDEEEDDGL